MPESAHPGTGEPGASSAYQRREPSIVKKRSWGSSKTQTVSYKVSLGEGTWNGKRLGLRKKGKANCKFRNTRKHRKREQGP